MKYTIQSSKYVAKNFFHIFLFALIPALFLSLSTAQKSMSLVMDVLFAGDLRAWDFVDLFRCISVLNFASIKSVGFGLLGVIFCAVFLFLLLQNCFSVLHICGAKTERICAISGIGVVIAVLLMGLFRYVWYDPVAMAMFFVVTALISAELRLIRAQHTVSQAQQMTSSYAELDYYIGG